MSYNLIDFNKNINTSINFDNLIIGKKIKINNNSMYYIYYNNNNELQDILIRLPKLKLIQNIFSNNMFDNVLLPIYPNWDKTDDFINFIHNLEEYIQELFNKKKLTFSSLIREDNNIQKIKIKLDKNKIMNFENIKLNGDLNIILKLNLIWINNNNYGLSLILCEIKYDEPIEYMNLNLLNNNIIIKPNININENINIEKKIIEPNIQKPAFKPDLKDISMMLNKLKKVN
jgi:hypothetical protein